MRAIAVLQWAISTGGRNGKRLKDGLARPSSTSRRLGSGSRAWARRAWARRSRPTRSEPRAVQPLSRRWLYFILSYGEPVMKQSGLGPARTCLYGPRLRQADRLEKANAVVIATRAGGDHMPFGLVSKKFGGQVPPGLRSPPPGSNARPLRVWDPPRLKYRSRVSAIALTRPAPPTGADGGAAGRGAWGNRCAARGLHQDRRLHRAAAGQKVGP